MPKAACKLMRYYAAQAQGFRPALKAISEATGIMQNHISSVRQLLVKWGLIGYDDDTIIIHWFRLRALASMEPKKMGKKQYWKLSPVVPELLDATKKGVHNYIGTRDSESQRIYAVYEATAQAVQDGVIFPELNHVQVASDGSNLLDATKKGVHNYIGNENSVGWYNPFDELDPEWVYQIPVADAYGEIVAYAHYNNILPF